MKFDNSSSKFILLSVSLHLALLLSVWLWPKDPPPQKQTELEIEVLENRASGSGKSRTTSQQNTAATRANPASTTATQNIQDNESTNPTHVQFGKDRLSGYLPGYRVAFDDMNLSGQDEYSRNQKYDSPYTEWGQGSQSVERIQDYTLYRVFYERIDGKLGYPGYLARRKINGTVNSRIVINQAGSCDWNKTKIHGTETHLSIYVLYLLKDICKENFKAHIKDRISTNVDASFQFKISEAPEQGADNSTIVGNTLMFYRQNHQSVLEWEFGPFRGMFPIPALYLNFPWIYENWDRLMHSKDPLKEFEKEFS